MKFLRNYLVLLAGILAFSAFNVEAQNTSVANTKSLEQKVFKEIITLPYYGVFDHIAFEVRGDTVILSGKVANGLNKKQAEREVRELAGVKTVINNIELLPPSSFDDSIRRRLVRDLYQAGSVYRYLIEPNPSVRIIVDGGNITFEGFVANRGDFNLMNIVANGVSGVFSVQNNLKIGKIDY